MVPDGSDARGWEGKVWFFHPSGGVFQKELGAGWSSPVAREAHNLEVTGSNPVPATLQMFPIWNGVALSGITWKPIRGCVKIFSVFPSAASACCAAFCAPSALGFAHQVKFRLYPILKAPLAALVVRLVLRCGGVLERKQRIGRAGPSPGRTHARVAPPVNSSQD